MTEHRHLVFGIPEGVIDPAALGLSQLFASELMACPQCGRSMYVACRYVRQIAARETRVICIACAVPRGTIARRFN